jgi:hypothetical protein
MSTLHFRELCLLVLLTLKQDIINKALAQSLQVQVDILLAMVVIAVVMAAVVAVTLGNRRLE